NSIDIDSSAGTFPSSAIYFFCLPPFLILSFSFITFLYFCHVSPFSIFHTEPVLPLSVPLSVPPSFQPLTHPH
uniref:Uncharacterized protein n=1 Tax=Myripristis murdjan TaxID=586833 RepID=A0A668A6D3_9TELE